MVRSFCAILIVTATATATATAATAEPLQAEDVVSAHVSYADLDLHSPAGMRALNTRVHSAIVRMCGSADLHDSIAMRITRNCRRTANADASVKVAMLGLGDRRLADRGEVMLAGR